MWNKIKEWFSPPQTVEPSVEQSVEPQTFEFVSTPSPKQVNTPVGPFKRGQWVMFGDKIGIVAEFRGADIMFHHVDRETGFTTKEEQLSVLAVRTAYISEIPPCRMSVSREVAKERGYGD